MDTVQITARISTKSRARQARRLMNNAESRLPIGEILDALILYTEDLNEWEDIEDWVQSQRKGQKKLRLAKDRDRKRRRG
jgi:hypothetical protein